MNAFFNWIRNISYDLVALLFPGFLFSICAFYIWNDNTFPSVLMQSSTEISESNAAPFSIIVWVIIFYIAGIALKWLASIKRISKKYRKGLASYNTPLQPLYEVAATKLAAKYDLEDGINNWGQLYIIVKTHILENSVTSSQTTYQNRYEMCNLISVAAYFLAALQITTLFYHTARILCLNLDTNYDIFSASSIFVTSLFLGYIFYLAYRKYWIVFGDQIIGHAILLSESKSTEKEN